METPLTLSGVEPQLVILWSFLSVPGSGLSREVLSLAQPVGPAWLQLWGQAARAGLLPLPTFLWFSHSPEGLLPFGASFLIRVARLLFRAPRYTKAGAPSKA